MDENRDIHFVLKTLGIRHLYPGKLTRQHFSAISQYCNYGRGLPTPTSCGDFLGIFLHGLKICHPFTRNIQIPRKSNSQISKYLQRGGVKEPTRAQVEKDPTDVHPLDVQVAIFLCCDHLAKQEFVSHLWKCRFGIPLLIQIDQLEPLNLYAWLSNAIDFTGVSKESMFEKRLRVVPLTNIGFLRLGNTSKSKSKILNKVICQSEKEHSIFFHRDNRASTKHRSIISNGLIEMALGHIPHLKECKFLNLRGDVKDYELQLTIMSQISGTFVVVSSLEHMELSFFIFKKLQQYQEKAYVLFLLTDLSEDDALEKETRVQRFAESIDKSVIFDVLPLQDVPENDVTHDILAFLSKTKCIPLFDLDDKLKDKVISDNDTFKHFDMVVAEMMQNFSRKRYELFPLSGQPFEEWSKANKEIKKLKHCPPDSDKESYMSKMESQKIEQRLNQVRLLKTSPQLSVKFLEIYTEIEESKRGVFLRILSQHLEDSNSVEARTAQENIKEIILSTKDVGTCLQPDRSENYLRHEGDIDAYLISMSDLMFEIGQMYEAHTDTTTVKHLPEIAAQIILSGYPFPLMDRHMSTVPIIWVNSVLKSLSGSLKEKEKRDVNIIVVSILGIQSTGKSCLLNTIFGARFPVGSGRCTRGIYMHIVRIVDNENVDYILVIDTEGLCAIEDYANPSKERELATFILGLADVTLLNIMGENITYLRDILPIAVHAFLRMNLVGLNPKCVVVHQNVDRVGKHSLQNLWYQLGTKLDAHTNAACEIERVSTKRFRDIVELNIEQDIYPFPPYKCAVGSIDPISEGYSNSCMELLKDLLANCRNRPVSLDVFREYINLLWTAVDKENFVYEFKNTAETGAKLKLSHHIQLLSWKIRQEARNVVLAMESDIQNTTTPEECNTVLAEKKQNLRQHMDDYLDRIEKEFDNLFVNAHPVFHGYLERLEKGAIQSLKHCYKNIIDVKIEDLKAIVGNKIRHLRLESLKSRKDLKEFTLKALDHNEHRTASQIHDSWIKRFEGNSDRGIEAEIDLHVSKVFFEAFPAHKRLVEQRLHEKQQLVDLEHFELAYKYFPFDADHASVQQQSDEIRILVNAVSVELERLLATRKQERRKFDPEVVIDVILLLRTNKGVKFGRLITNIEFELDLTLAILEYTKKELIEIETQILTEETEFSPLQDEKGHIQDILQVVRENKEKCIDNLLSILKEGVCTKLSGEVITITTSKLRNYKKHGTEILSSKRTFMLYIFWRILEEDGKYLFNAFSQYPTGAMRSCLSELFDCWCRCDDKGQGVIEQEIETFVRDLFGKIKAEISYSDRDMNKELWLGHIYKKLQKILPLPEMKFETVLPVNPEQAIQKITEMEHGVIKQSMTLFFERDYDNIRSQVVEILLENVRGCTERCPKCKEICMYDNHGHTVIHDHKVLVHRPLFLGGGSTELMTCNQFYKNENPDMLGWDVVPAMPTSDSFWQLCAVLYGSRDPTTLPDSWKDWNRNMEQEKLVVEMNNCLI